MAVLRHSLAACVALLGAPFVAGSMMCRRGWREGLGERLGASPRQVPGAIWLHGASVGESRLVARMAVALGHRGRQVFATLQTVSGRSVLQEHLPRIPCALAPVDHLWCVERSLGRVSPAVIVLFETEIWPCWIAAATRRQVPVVLVSGRISDRSWPRYRLIAPVMGPVLRQLSRIGARSQEDADRFIALGADPARVRVTGDLKLSPPVESMGVAEDLQRALHGRNVFIAGSTHPGEEEAAAEAANHCRRAGHAMTLVIAPRHLERIPAVERRLRDLGCTVRRRSRLGAAPISEGEILLLDTHGELQALYGIARFALVGGTLCPVGGHDPIEAVRGGCPIAVGPHHANVRESVELLVAAGVATVVSDADALGRVVAAALTDPKRTLRVDVAHLLEGGSRALEHSLELIDAVLHGGSA